MSPGASGFTRHAAETDPHATDRRLRGRTYAIPFDRVWTVALALAGGGIPRWEVQSADDRAGRIVARLRTTLTRRQGEAGVWIRLDENGQTRVDVRVDLEGRRGDLGASARDRAFRPQPRPEPGGHPAPDPRRDARAELERVTAGAWSPRRLPRYLPAP